MLSITLSLPKTTTLSARTDKEYSLDNLFDMIQEMAGLFIVSPGARPWEEDEFKPIPLQLVNISATVENFIAEILMTQKYRNKERNPLEVVYRFPVEEDAAVTACSAVLDGKTIVAKIQENKKAEKMYNDAISEKKTAVMLSSTRPDIFEMKIGHLAPGSECSVTIKYVMELPVEEGKTRLTIPTTIAPKYIADRHSSSVVPKVKKILCMNDDSITDSFLGPKKYTVQRRDSGSIDFQLKSCNEDEDCGCHEPQSRSCYRHDEEL